ncbi:MAG: hypothetical protein KJZ74_00205 [Gemmatimonadales bacterium]|nr:hypothetical protein [Gemmatimonadota bacterium]MCL4212307.1 hypothetical protein [Gemmatimonadales bacterium]
MRRIVRSLAAFGLALALLPPAARAQTAAPATPAVLPDSEQVALSAFALSAEGIEMNGRFVRGNSSVAAGDTLRGPLVVMSGTAEVFGVVAGNVYALWGDVVIHDGADVYGSANAYRGRVILDGGRVRGSLSATPTDAAALAPAPAPMTRARALQLSAGWTAMSVIIGLLVLVLLSSNLEATARTLEQEFGRSFFAGVLGQLGFLPLLLFICVALAVTVVGILLIPFALVAAPIALAGFVTLGWLALALVSGRAILRAQSAGSSRADALRALTAGVVLLMLPWVIVSLITGTGTVAALAKLVAIAITWVAATAGLGAAVLSKAGTRQKRAPGASAPKLQGWQTPTPVAGVAAARRPIPARPGAAPK